MPADFWLQLLLYIALMLLSPICASYLLKSKAALPARLRGIFLAICAVIFALSFVMLLILGSTYPIIRENIWRRPPGQYRQV